MKKYIHLLLFFTYLNTYGQGISITPNTPYATFSGQDISVSFIPSAGALGPYTIELIEIEARYCDSKINEITKASIISNTTSATLTIPCCFKTGVVNNGNCEIDYTYYLRVSNNDVLSENYPILLYPNAKPIFGLNISPTMICENETTNVRWYSSGVSENNVFNIELSDVNGSFSNPSLLATVSGNNSDGLKMQLINIPQGTNASLNYKIRVTSSEPYSTITGKLIVKPSINCGPINSLSISNSSSVCQGNTHTITWKNNGTIGLNNVFTAELSDNLNTVSYPLGNISSQTAESMQVVVPNNVPTGYYYLKLRVSNINGSSYTSFSSNGFGVGLSKPIIAIESNCEGGKFELFVFSYQPEKNYSFNWKKDSLNINAQNQTTQFLNEGKVYYTRNIAQSSDAGNYSFTLTRKQDGCTAASDPIFIPISSVIPAPSTTPVTVISGNTATLAASNCSGRIVWYSSATAQDAIESGSFLTPEITQPTTYYAACEYVQGENYATCISPRTPLTISLTSHTPPNAPTLSISANNYCRNISNYPTITASGCSGTVRWYKTYERNANFYLYETTTQAPHQITIPDGVYTIFPKDTTYYYTDCRINGVLSSTKSEIIYINKSIPNTPNISPNSNDFLNINNGSNVRFDAKGCNGTVKWYDSDIAITPLSTGTSYITPNLFNNTTNNIADYKIYYSCQVNGCESERQSSIFSIYKDEVRAPAIVFDQTNRLCSGNSKTIFAHGCSNGIVRWYDDQFDGNLIGTGQNVNTPVLSFNENGGNGYRYYAECELSGIKSGRQGAYFYVVRNPETIMGNPSVINCNTSTTLFATGCNTFTTDIFIVKWYKDNTSLEPIGTGLNFVTPILKSNTTYYVSCANGNCETSRVPVPITVLCPPDTPVVSSHLTTVCTGSGINLSATGCSGTINWSDGGSGTSRANVIFNASISLSATCTVGNLTSGASNTLLITVNPKPILVITNPAAVSPPNTINITLLAITVGSTLPPNTSLRYYTDADATITLNNPSAVTTSGTYFIKATTTNGCFDIKPVVVVINDCSTPIVLVSTADDYSSGIQLKKTNETITATNIVTASAQATYRSNKSILLNAGFKAQPTTGGFFKAEIRGCD
ncbi:hypothetical protein EMA8858_03919 [Emticicia aquatica]|uniref:Ig-like domain-containing protein n=1 Tax=Emticicia aquatica TaxID=1681835 RepID=A0ABM9AVL2_9BACT|nr:3-coathanger stack domain-containing protein [Emticicia aquatica]CAH0997785.1 hypothetical protein EMA8858_03919 [Emticicia aquatica]